MKQYYIKSFPTNTPASGYPYWSSKLNAPVYVPVKGLEVGPKDYGLKLMLCEFGFEETLALDKVPDSWISKQLSIGKGSWVERPIAEISKDSAQHVVSGQKLHVSDFKIIHDGEGKPIEVKVNTWEDLYDNVSLRERTVRNLRSFSE